MPRRSAVSIDDVCELGTLVTAFGQAARGKRHRDDVTAFAGALDQSLAALGDDIRSGVAPYGRWTELCVFDPKSRRILAPCFADRVLHHALMAHMGPVLERALVADPFACRVGKGTLAAVVRAQAHARRFPWWVKVDVRAFFASIDHDIMLAVLRRRFKDEALLGLCARILARTAVGAGTGLPIGALTSQHFANAYLGALDRWLLERFGVRGMVRYVDDVVWFCDTRAAARASLLEAQALLMRERRLEFKPGVRVGRSDRGFGFLGFVVHPAALRLSLRRKRRYVATRRAAERAFASGRMNALALQRRYASALAITAHADALGFRAAEPRRRPEVDP
jgi:RNA-directed DNA polymerase